MIQSILLLFFLALQPLYGDRQAGEKCQERYLEFEWDASWEKPEEGDEFREEEMGADWPGKREDPFYDTLTR